MDTPSVEDTFMVTENRKARGSFCILHTENRIQVGTDMTRNCHITTGAESRP